MKFTNALSGIPPLMHNPTPRPAQHTFFVIVLGLFLLVFSLFAYSLHNRTLHVDEAILSEHAYWLAKEGKVKSLMYTGVEAGWEEELLVYHRLFIWTGAALIHFFGLSLPILRMVSLTFSILLCANLYFYCRKYYCALAKEEAVNVFLFCLLVLFLHVHFFAYSFFYRPEIMQCTLGFGSFYFLRAYLDKEKKFHLSISAILAGLAALTHLNGLLYIGAGAALLVVNKQFKPAFWFCFGGAAVTSLYFINLLNPGSLERFFWQFTQDPAIEENDYSLIDRIGRVLNEQKRYFHTQKEGAFSLFFMLILFLQRKYIWKQHRALLLYMFFGALFLAGIAQSQTSKYALLLLPFACVLLSFAFYQLLAPVGRKTYIALAAFLIYAGIQLDANFALIAKKVDVPSRNAEIASHIPEGHRVYATASFFFNEVQNYTLLGTHTFNLNVDRYGSISRSKEGFFTYVHTLDCEYIVLDFLFQSILSYGIFQPSDFRERNTFYGYEVIQAKNNYVILKRLD